MTMPNETASFDASAIPELLRLAHEVNESGTPREIMAGHETLAVLMPAAPAKKPRRGKKSREERWNAFLRAAGSWADIDTDALLKQIYEARERSYRQPVDL